MTLLHSHDDLSSAVSALNICMKDLKEMKKLSNTFNSLSWTRSRVITTDPKTFIKESIKALQT